MSNVLLWGTILIYALASFSYTYNLAGVNRAFYGIYKAVAETSVVAYATTGKAISPYFSEALFTEKCEAYFAAALRPYTSSYSLSFYFCDADTKESSSQPTQAEVGLTCSVFTMKTYCRSARFYIEEGKHGGE